MKRRCPALLAGPLFAGPLFAGWLLAGSLLSGTVASTLVAQPRMRARDIDTIPLREPGARIAYGTDSLQFGELRLPPGRGPFPVAIVLHGGCWFSPFASLRNSAPLAQAIADAGVATWNVEYRRYDHPGGGWPGTFRDVAQAADHLRVLARRYAIDTTRLVAVGHSAGGHLALWLASRRAGAPGELFGADDHPHAPMRLAGVVSVGGIADLHEFFGRERATCGNPAVESLLGGHPDSVPARVRMASPIARLPLGVPTAHVAGAFDRIAPAAVLEQYASAARQRGDSVELLIIPGAGHFEVLSPAHPAGKTVVALVRRFADMPAPPRVQRRRD